MYQKGKKTFLEMIKEALTSLNEYNGSSRQAIVKYVTTNYEIDPKGGVARVRSAISKSLEDGDLRYGRTKYVIKIGDKVKKDSKTKELGLKRKANKILLPQSQPKVASNTKTIKTVTFKPKVLSSKKTCVRLSSKSFNPKFLSTPIVSHAGTSQVKNRLANLNQNPLTPIQHKSPKRSSNNENLACTPTTRRLATKVTIETPNLITPMQHKTLKRLVTPGRGVLKRVNK